MTTKNEFSNTINNDILSLINGEERTYLSSDSVVSDDEDCKNNYTTEFLNKQQPSGMPPHELRLKVGSIVMLIRNIDPKNGLLNGTRMVVEEMHDHIIKCKILKSNNKDTVCVIPRIVIAPSET